MFPSGILLQVPVISSQILYHYTIASACMIQYAHGTFALYNNILMRTRSRCCMSAVVALDIQRCLRFPR